MRIILTDLGEQLASEGFLTGVFPKITKVKFGDGNGNTVVPDKAMTTLVNFIQDGLGTTIARFNNPNRLYIYTMIPVTIGGFTVREIGLFTEADELIAIGGEFEKVKPPIGESTENFDFYITLPISSTQEITVEFSNDNIYASQAALDVLANLEEVNRLAIQALDVLVQENIIDIANLETIKANLANPNLTGIPTAPTAPVGTNTTQLATTAFVLANSVKATDYSKSLSANGYQKLPSGLIIQWGGLSGNSGVWQTRAFPIIFPTALVAVVTPGIMNNNTNYGGVAATQPISTAMTSTPLNNFKWCIYGGDGNWGGQFIAIGY